MNNSAAAGLSSTNATQAKSSIGKDAWLKKYVEDPGVLTALASASWIQFKWNPSSKCFTFVTVASSFNREKFSDDKHTQLPLLTEGTDPNLLQNPAVAFFLQEIIRQMDNLKLSYTLNHWSELDHLAGAYIDATNGIFVQLDGEIGSPEHLPPLFSGLFALQKSVTQLVKQREIGPKIHAILREMTTIPVLQNMGEKMAAMFLMGNSFIPSTSDGLKLTLFITETSVRRAKKRLGEFVAYGPLTSYIAALQALACSTPESAVASFQSLRSAIDDAFKLLDPKSPTLGGQSLHAMATVLKQSYYGRPPSVGALQALLTSTTETFSWGYNGYADLFPVFSKRLGLGPFRLNRTGTDVTVAPTADVHDAGHVNLTPSTVSSSASWMALTLPEPDSGSMYVAVIRGLAGAAGKEVVKGSALGIKEKGGMQVNARATPAGPTEYLTYAMDKAEIGYGLSGTVCDGKSYVSGAMPSPIPSLDDGKLIVSSDTSLAESNVTVMILHPQIPFEDPTGKYVNAAKEIVTGMDPSKVDPTAPWWRCTIVTEKSFASFWMIARHGVLLGSRDSKIALLHMPIPSAAYEEPVPVSSRTVRDVIGSYRILRPASSTASSTAVAVSASSAAVAVPATLAVGSPSLSVERAKELLNQRLTSLTARPKDPKLLADWLATSSSREEEMKNIKDELKTLSPKPASNSSSSNSSSSAASVPFEEKKEETSLEAIQKQLAALQLQIASIRT